MPDNSIDPMVMFDGPPTGGSTAGAVNPQQPAGGGGPAVGLGAATPDGYAPWRMAVRRPMGAQAPQMGGLGAPHPPVDLQMVAALAHLFSRMMAGQQAGGPPIGGLPGYGGGSYNPSTRTWQQPGTGNQNALGIPAFANGGIVTQPTIGLLGERGPEAVVPLGQSSLWGQAQQGLQNQGASNAQNYGGANGYQGVGGGVGSARSRVYGFLNNAGTAAGPDPGITEMLRQRAIQDAAAQSRSARLGLMGQTTVDASTYGYQSLMSDLQGQQNTAKALSDAQLQQSLAFQQFIRGLLGQQNQNEWAAYMNAQNQPGFDFGGLAGGIGAIGSGFGFGNKK